MTSDKRDAVSKRSRESEGEVERKKPKWDIKLSELLVTGDEMESSTITEMLTRKAKIMKLRIRIAEIKSKLKRGNFVPENPAERSPSPEPLYNNYGTRVNTREAKARAKLNMELMNITEEFLELDHINHSCRTFKGCGLSTNAVKNLLLPLAAKSSTVKSEASESQKTDNAQVIETTDVPKSASSEKIQNDVISDSAPKSEVGRDKQEERNISNEFANYSSNMSQSSYNDELAIQSEVALETGCRYFGNEEDKLKIFVKHFPPWTKESKLIELFSPFGRILEAEINDVDTELKLQGFVKYNDSKSAVKAAAQMNGYAYEGSNLVVISPASYFDMGLNPQDTHTRNVPLLLNSPSSSIDESRKCQIFVKNLPLLTQESKLVRLFSLFGRILKAEVKDSVGPVEECHGIVEYDDRKSAVKATTRMDGYMLEGSALTVTSSNYPPSNFARSSNPCMTSSVDDRIPTYPSQVADISALFVGRTLHCDNSSHSMPNYGINSRNTDYMHGGASNLLPTTFRSILDCKLMQNNSLPIPGENMDLVMGSHKYSAKLLEHKELYLYPSSSHKTTSYGSTNRRTMPEFEQSYEMYRSRDGGEPSENEKICTSYGGTNGGKNMEQGSFTTSYGLSDRGLKSEHKPSHIRPERTRKQTLSEYEKFLLEGL